MDRIFLVGNGPSLSETDLSKTEVSFGMNRIHLIYPHTSWRPTHYMWSDHPQHRVHAEEIISEHISQGYDVWLRDDVAEIITGDYVCTFGELENALEELPPHVHAWERCVKHIAAHYDDDMRPDEFCERFIDERKFCKYGSGMSSMIQHAVDWGYNELILVGCDLNYRTDVDGYDPNHFDGSYNPIGFWDEENVHRHYETIRHGHKLASKWARENNIQILNATIGGNLEEYERVDFDSLF